MRFKKGTRVEVLTNKDVPSGSWRCAEIVSGNGHNYMVRYDGYETVLERVSRKEIRPCPPPPEIGINWVPGDVVEVFHCFSWKMATILKVLDKKCFLVRILGSSLEFRVSKCDTRARQSWQDNGWIVIGKGSVNSEDREHNEPLTLKNNQKSRNHVQMSDRKKNTHARDDYSPGMNKTKFLDSNNPPCKVLKRRHHSHFQVEACHDGPPRKLRAIQKVGEQQRVFVSKQFILPGQVDTVSFPVEKARGIQIHAFDNKTGLHELEGEKRKSMDVGYSFALEVEPRTADSVTSSVGSCNITTYNSYKSRHPSGFIEDIDSNSSDAESLYQGKYEERNSSHPTNEELAAEIHRLELYAYRCTMEALHASGPLSWERESMVTNLRLSLHISNDEHLMEGQSEKLIDLTSTCGAMLLGLPTFSWPGQLRNFMQLAELSSVCFNFLLRSLLMWMAGCFHCCQPPSFKGVIPYGCLHLLGRFKCTPFFRYSVNTMLKGKTSYFPAHFRLLNERPILLSFIGGLCRLLASLLGRSASWTGPTNEQVDAIRKI